MQVAIDCATGSQEEQGNRRAGRAGRPPGFSYPSGKQDLLTGAGRVGLDGLTEDVVERPSRVQSDPLGVTSCAPQILDRAALAVLMPPGMSYGMIGA